MMMICSKAIGEEGWVENLNKYRLSVVTIRANAPADDVITIMIVLQTEWGGGEGGGEGQAAMTPMTRRCGSKFDEDDEGGCKTFDSHVSRESRYRIGQRKVWPGQPLF